MRVTKWYFKKRRTGRLCTYAPVPRQYCDKLSLEQRCDLLEEEQSKLLIQVATKALLEGESMHFGRAPMLFDVGPIATRPHMR